MNGLAQVVLALWLPAAFVLFVVLPARRAAIVAVLTAWLFLPNGRFVLPGLPDYSKYIAPGLAALLGALIFDGRRLGKFRPRWFDAPMALWGIGVAVTPLVNELGGYECLSDVATWVGYYLSPYLVGRIYLDDLTGFREYYLALLTVGLIYSPFCLVECVTGPYFENRVYGAPINLQPARFGLGYRPQVFMMTGLELGLLMCGLALLAWWGWTSGVYRRIGWLPAWVVTLILTATGILTKSVGAIQLMAAGVFALWLAKRAGQRWALVVLLLVPPVYMGVRVPRLWSGESMVSLTRELLGEERGQSLETRLVCEDRLVARALERPVWGWGGQGRSRAGLEVVTDGLWVIILGTLGFVGLTAWTGTSLLGPALFVRRVPPRRWGSPHVAPAAAFAVLLVLFAIDCLSNAMISPLYYMALGGLVGLADMSSGHDRRLADGLLGLAGSLEKAGEPVALDTYAQAAAAYNERLTRPNGVDPSAVQGLAFAHESMGRLLLAARREAEAEAAWSLAVELRRSVFDADPRDALAAESLASALEGFARATRRDENGVDRAVEARTTALSIRESLVAQFPGEASFRTTLAEARNDLAWLLASHESTNPEKADRAVTLAKGAIELAPGEPAYRNTLGLALLAIGDWAAAAETLKSAMALVNEPTSFDHFPLAIALARLGDRDEALVHYRLGTGWTELHAQGHLDVKQLQAAAEQALGQES